MSLTAVPNPYAGFPGPGRCGARNDQLTCSGMCPTCDAAASKQVAEDNQRKWRAGV